MKKKDIIQLQVNHNVLIWARESLAMSRNQACERSDISDRRLVQLEEGEQLPTLDELKALSKVYKRTIATLLLAERPKEKPLPRDRRTVDSKDLNAFHEKTIVAIRKARALGSSLIELKKELGIEIPRINFSLSINDNPRDAAHSIGAGLRLNEIREEEGVNHTLALEEYISKVESLGIAIFQLSLIQDDLRGFSIIDEGIPIIGIRKNDQITGKIFTLFHELGHILLREDGSCDISGISSNRIEEWCNAFSAEILIPSDELKHHPLVIAHKQSGQNDWQKQLLAQIGDHFHAGPLAILRGLLEIGLTTREFYFEKHKIWNTQSSFGRSQHPEGRNPSKETIKEKGKSYVSLAFQAFDQNRINLKDLSDYLGIKLSYIPKTRQLLNA
ncbi:MAG: XRE family transcriptional regulator [Candidatus Kapaibacterium sp.]